MSEDHAERQAAAEAELAAVKQEATEEEMAASAERTEKRGWPILLDDGTEVMVVRKEATPSGVVLVAEDGTEYEPTGNGFSHVKVGESMSEADTEDVQETGTTPPPADDDELAA